MKKGLNCLNNPCESDRKGKQVIDYEDFLLGANTYVLAYPGRKWDCQHQALQE